VAGKLVTPEDSNRTPTDDPRRPGGGRDNARRIRVRPASKRIEVFLVL
jgi:hypothetical protein